MRSASVGANWQTDLQPVLESPFQLPNWKDTMEQQGLQLPQLLLRHAMSFQMDDAASIGVGPTSHAVLDRGSVTRG